MKIKTITAALLIVIMSLAVFAPVAAENEAAETPIPAAVAESVTVNDQPTPFTVTEINSENMETAILAVKKLIDIETDVLSEFSYNFYEYNYGTGKSSGAWSFTWTDKEYSKSIYATVLDDGYVLNFNKYENNYDYSQKLKNISRSETEKIAENFLKKLLPDSAKYYKLSEYYTYLTSNEISLRYNVEMNGYFFYYLPVNISVNKFTGEVISMSRDLSNLKDYNFIYPAGLIIQSDALEAYDKKLGFELFYNYYYDYGKKELKVYPIYQAKESGKYINALTGEVVYVPAGSGVPVPMAAAAGAMGEEVAYAKAMDRGLSAGEKAAVENVKNSITSEQAINMIRNIAGIEGETNCDASLYKHYINKDQYIWNIYINYENSSANGSVDAATGKVLSYNYYEYSGKKEKDAKKLSPEELKKIALDAIESLSSANLGNYIDKSDYESINESDYYSLQFYKKVNGVPYLGSGISVYVNALTGKLQSYSFSELICDKFPDVSNIKTTGEVLKTVVETIPYEIKYEAPVYNEETKKYDVSLVYDFQSGFSYIDPFTGKFLSYDGTVTEIDSGKPDYSDITDEYLKNAVDSLIENGVTLWNGKFGAMKEMTEKEFYNIAYSFFSSGAIRYNYNYSTDKEKSLSDSPIKRKDACKMICEILGYDTLAKNQKIFANPFNNSIDLEYKGYVAVCNGLNMIHLDNPNNMYNANANLTRADFVYMLYGYIKNN